METYLTLLKHVKNHGIYKNDRTGTGCRSVFGYQMRFNLALGFPLVTTKKCNLDAIIHELIWFLQGETTLDYLHKNNVKIWDEWAYNGCLGPIYGKQWRSWSTTDSIDQLSQVIHTLKNNPNSRRIIVSAWNPTVLPDEHKSPQENVKLGKQALPPCHCLFQFFVANEHLSCQLYQRSADVFLGVPFNIASYSLLTMMIAQVCNLKIGEFIHTFGDVHLYENHIDQAETQLTRKPYPAPKMLLNPNIKNLFTFKHEDFKLINYHHHPFISAPISV